MNDGTDLGSERVWILSSNSNQSSIYDYEYCDAESDRCSCVLEITCTVLQNHMLVYDIVDRIVKKDHIVLVRCESLS